MKNRHIEALTQLGFNLKAARRTDIFEIKATKDRREVNNRLNNLIHILGGQANREGIKAAKLLK